jgi:hypothetical protein
MIETKTSLGTVVMVALATRRYRTAYLTLLLPVQHSFSCPVQGQTKAETASETKRFAVQNGR